MRRSWRAAVAGVLAAGIALGGNVGPAFADYDYKRVAPRAAYTDFDAKGTAPRGAGATPDTDVTLGASEGLTALRGCRHYQVHRDAPVLEWFNGNPGAPWSGRWESDWLQVAPSTRSTCNDVNVGYAIVETSPGWDNSCVSAWVASSSGKAWPMRTICDGVFTPIVLASWVPNGTLYKILVVPWSTYRAREWLTIYDGFD